MGGDTGKSEVDWVPGFIGVAHVIREPYDFGYNGKEKYFKFDIEVDCVFEKPFKREDFLSYREAYDAPYIGPELSRDPSQALSTLDKIKAVAVIRAVLDEFPEMLEKFKEIFDREFMDRVLGAVTVMIPTSVKFGESKEDAVNSIQEEMSIENEGSEEEEMESKKTKYPIKEIKFCNNYRFRTNESMKELDRLIRSYGNSYAPSEFTASINLKQLSNDTEEDNFIVEGIEKIIGNSNDKVAVLVRAGNQGESIAVKLKRKGILYFNALFKDTDVEFLKFYEIAIDEFHNATCDSGKALQRDLQSCLEAVSQRQNEIYADYKRKFVYDAMYKLLEVLFEESKKWEGTSKDRYENIDFILGSKGLKHMMEYIEEKVVLTTIHASKGLEWEYVIIPRMNAYAFPSGYMCGPCRNDYSCNNGFDYCQFSFGSSMEKAFKEEISVFYVAITRAKKNVFLTVNTGLNQWGYAKQKSCLVELQGLSLVDYTWEDIIL